MDKVILLTKQDCPNCEQLKKFLHFALQDRYAEDFDLVHREADAVRFQELVNRHHIKETPTLIYHDYVLSGFAPQAVVNFLQQHLGKK